MGDAVFAQHPMGQALLLADKTQQQVLGAYIAVAHILGGLLGEPQNLLGMRGKFILIHHRKQLLCYGVCSFT